MRTAWLCDFDGTIAPHDIGAGFVRRFAVGGDAERARLFAEWRAGGIGSRELTEAECSWVRVTQPEAGAYAASFDIDPTFAGFVAGVEARHDRLLVASDGFEFYIQPLLERCGLGRVPVSANHMRFEGGRAVPEFPNAGRGCGRCGNCKGDPARRMRDEGDCVVMVGDGMSDRCGARIADHVLARGALAEWCAAEGLAWHPFRSFADVAEFARTLPGYGRAVGA